MMKMTTGKGVSVVFGAVACCTVFAAADGLEMPQGEDCWAWIKSHPAVVNPVVPVAAREDVLSLRGDWEFVAHSDFRGQFRNHQDKSWSQFYERAWTGTRTIRVPGCWEAQGVGEPGQGVPWNSWDNSPKEINHRYMGSGWYRKTVTIPAGWAGRRVWLKIGGIRSQGWVWVNDEQVAHVNNWCGTYKYEITPFVKPGEAVKIVVQADNMLPPRKGYDCAVHHWGGIYRDMELESTPQTYIDDAWVRGDFDRQVAEAHVEVGPEGSEGLEVRFGVDGQAVSAPVAKTGGETVLRLPLKDFRAWSPERPNLYTGCVELVENGTVIQRRYERFGIRKLEVRGKEFYLNNRPFFIRGFGDDYVYPETGVSPADRDYHRRHLAAARAAGFNYVRHHTHCENPEYFEAADECGILIQAETPYYCDMPGSSFAFDPVRDVTELWRNYRRHPSFGTYSMGNEGTFGRQADAAIHRYVKAMDPDRFKINQDSRCEWINPAESSDYLGGLVNVWPRGSYNPDRPFVAHEYLNLSVKFDSRLEPRFTGAWAPPVRRAERLAWLNRFGLDAAWGDRLQDAQHVLQGVYQKRGMEAGRSDPYCDGLIFWTVVDVVVRQQETYTAQGLFNPFWEQKPGGLTAAEFAQFNSAQCVLADFEPSARILTSGETLKADVLFSNYGEAALQGASASWTLTADGRTIAGGGLPAVDAPLGPVRKVATLTAEIPPLAKPVAARMSVTVGGVSNAWDLWLFPKRTKADGRTIACAPALRDVLARHYENLLPMARAAEARVVVAPWPSVEAQEALARGQRVVAIGPASGDANVSLGWWNMGDQVGMALLRHPALGDLPHDGALTPLLFRIVKHGRKLPWKGLANEDLVVVGEGGDSCALYLAGANCGKGRVLASFGLDLSTETPEGGSILRGMIDYAGSEAFAPKGRVELEGPAVVKTQTLPLVSDAAALDRHFGFRTPPVGWMTGYAILDPRKVDENFVLKNARAFKEKFGRYLDERPVLWQDWEWFHTNMYDRVDSGYDGTCPRKDAYPRGMKALADDLKSLGFVPALWITVLNDVGVNALLKPHPEWLLKDVKYKSPEKVGKKVSSWAGTLWVDADAPGVLDEYVPGLFRLYLDWGYEAFKWDNMPQSYPLYGGETMRKVVAAARRTIGKDAYLLCCAEPPDYAEPSFESFSAIRVGADVWGWGGYVTNAVHKMLEYAPLHGNRLLCDMDNVLLRKEYSNEAQARTRVSICALCGAPLTVGDEIEALDDFRIGLYRAVMPVVPARSLATNRLSCAGDSLSVDVTYRRPFGSWRVQSLSNFGTDALEGDAGEAGCAVWDFWRDRLVSANGPARVRIPPGDTGVFRVTRLAGEAPTLLSVSRHITQGGYELEDYAADAQGARGRVRVPGGETVRVTLLLPEGTEVAAASHPWTREGRVLRLGIDSDEKGTVDWKVSFK